MSLINIKNFLYSMIFFSMFLVGNLHSIGVIQRNNVDFSNLLVMLILFVLISILLIENNFRMKKSNIRYSLLYILFGIAVTVSLIVNSDFSITYSILYWILIPLLLQLPMQENLVRVLLLNAIFSLIPILFWLNFGNTLGMLYALLGILLFIYFENFYKKNILLLLSVAFISVVIYITESRTALLSYILVLLAYYFLRMFSKSNTKSRKQIIVIFSILAVSIIALFNTIKSFVLSKYTNSSIDVLSSRTTFWKGALYDGFDIWGHGQDYFIYRFGIGNSHNTFIEVLAVYGWIPAVIFYIILILYVFKSNTVTLPFIMLFFAMSMTENLLIIDTRLVLYFILFVVLFNFSISKRSERKLR